MAHVPPKVLVSTHNHPLPPQTVDPRSCPVHLQKELLLVLAGADPKDAQQAKTEV